MVYATDSAWNGELVTNIKATVFDRRGYVVFPIVPLGTTLTDLEIRKMVDATLTSYVPVPDDTHASFVSDDKVAVAAAAAIGVLATLVKVKFGKAAVGGLLAAALLFLKKGCVPGAGADGLGGAQVARQETRNRRLSRKQKTRGFAPGS